jgi:hypothetical protein
MMRVRGRKWNVGRKEGRKESMQIFSVEHKEGRKGRGHQVHVLQDAQERARENT